MVEPIPGDADDRWIAEALEDASLPALIPALVHLTGDLGLIERYASREIGRNVDDVWATLIKETIMKPVTEAWRPGRWLMAAAMALGLNQTPAFVGSTARQRDQPKWLIDRKRRRETCQQRKSSHCCPRL